MLLLSAEIDLDHPLIILHLVERSIAENVSLVQNRDLASELTNENHVVLDDNDRMLPSQTEKKIPSLSRFLVGHAGCRLINQEKLSVLREQHADLEPLFLPVSEISGLGFSTVLETDDFQHFEDTLALGGTHASEDRTPNAAAAFKTKENIFEDSVVGIDAWR